MVEVSDVTTAIEAGDLDGHLDDIVLAIVERARTGVTAFYWRITIDGDEWTQETVTLGELKFAEQHAKVTDQNGRTRRATMAEIDPRGSAEHLVALLTARFFKADGLPLPDAVKKAENYPASVLADAVGEYEVVRPPKDDTASTGSTIS
jgi:hypothetical protein